MKDLKSCLRQLSAFIRPVRWRLFVSVAIGLVQIAASLSFVWICKRLVDIATGNIDAPLMPAIMTMVAIMLLQMACRISSSYWESYIQLMTKNSERYRLFGRIIRSRWHGKESFHSGDIINRLEADIDIVVNLVCVRIPDVFVTLCQLLAASVFLLSMASGLAWLLIALMVVAVVGSRLFFHKIRELSAHIRSREGEIQGYMQESIQNRLVIMTFTGIERVMEHLGWLQKDVRDTTVKRLNYGAIGRSFMNLGFMAGYAAAFLKGIFGIIDKSVTYGMMTAFLQLVGQIQRPISDIARHVPAFIHALTSIERLMDLEEQPLEESGDDIVIEGAPEITLKNVSFTYPDGAAPVIERFSYTFEGGKITTIAGHTGIGKSTLIRLILALLKPDEGEILIGAAPASADTRCNFMYVPQGNSLMSGTIRENLMLAREDATEAEMMEALDLAAADFVKFLPDGLDTVCSEKGGGLSEGQAQRIAIARSLLKRGGILILDEATSAVDPDTERRILDNLSARFRGQKTILFISHREAVTRITDNILQMGIN